MKGKLFSFLNLILLLLEMETNVSSCQRRKPPPPREVLKQSMGEGKQIVVSITTR